MAQPPKMVPFLNELSVFLNNGEINEDGSFTSPKGNRSSPKRNLSPHAAKSPRPLEVCDINLKENTKITEISTNALSPRFRKKSPVELRNPTNLSNKETKVPPPLIPPPLIRQTGRQQLFLLTATNTGDTANVCLGTAHSQEEVVVRNPLYLNKHPLSNKNRGSCPTSTPKSVNPFKGLTGQNKVLESNIRTCTPISEKQIAKCLRYVLKKTFDTNLNVLESLGGSPQVIWENHLKKLFKNKPKELSTDCPEDLKKPLTRIITLTNFLTNGVDWVNERILNAVDISLCLNYLCDELRTMDPSSKENLPRTPQDIWSLKLQPYLENLSQKSFPAKCPKEIIESLDKFLLHVGENYRSEQVLTSEMLFTNTQNIRGVPQQENIVINGLELNKKLPEEELMKFDETLPHTLDKVPRTILAFYSNLFTNISRIKPEWEINVESALKNLFLQKLDLKDRKLISLLTQMNTAEWAKWHIPVQTSIMNQLFSHPWESIHLRQMPLKGEKFAGVPNATTCKLSIADTVLISPKRKFKTIVRDTEKPVATFSITVDCQPSMEIGVPDRAKIKLTDFSWDPEATKKDKKAFKKSFFAIS